LGSQLCVITFFLISHVVEQEVKESAIATMATILANFSSTLKQRVKQSLSVLMQRLRNEVTRHSALDAFAQIANASVRVDLSSIIHPTIKELCIFMRKVCIHDMNASLFFMF